MLRKHLLAVCDVLGYFLLIALFYYVMIIPMQHYLFQIVKHFGKSNTLATIFTNLAQVSLPGGVILGSYLYIKIRRGSPIQGLFDHSAFRKFGIGACIGSVLALSLLLIQVTCGWMTIDFYEVPNWESKVIINGIWIPLVYNLAISITEEVVCRGILLEVFGKYLGIGKGIIYSSLVFAIFHILRINGNEDWYIYISTMFIFGIIISVLYLKARSIWTAIGIHYLWNVLIFIIYGLGENIDFEFPIRIDVLGPEIIVGQNGVSYSPESGIIVLLLMIIVLSGLLFFGKVSPQDN